MQKNRIKDLRTARGWTQSVLGSKIDASKETIYAIEKHKQRITATQARDLALAFGVKIDELYESDFEPAFGFSEEAEPFVPDVASFESHIPLTEHQSWYRIKKSHVDQIGYLDGDHVIIDISRDAMNNVQIGDVVIANKYAEKGALAAETIVRQFIPPSLLITNSLGNNLPILNTSVDDVTILGVIVHPRKRGAIMRKR